ncbi:hypothetical protein BZL29_4962 [Mycobacterium kansasii]|uniref:Uncharacterized protein n=1 Tax=Mycobacterium kansasii TaxID=1768 RepID=A0A1V3X1A9_MYCKA|nr:hypothetical protein BZL29_4962 [Mycobacterium kansasii]
MLLEIFAQCAVRVREATQALAAVAGPASERLARRSHPNHWATTVDKNHVPVLPSPPASL